MNHWLVCLPRPDLEHCIKIGTYGLKRKNVISQVQAGDKIVCVVTREPEWKAIALGVTTSDYYVDDKAIFREEGLFIDRFDFKAKKLKKELGFAALIPILSVIKRPEYYAAYFKNGIIRISPDDWKKMTKLAGLDEL